MSLKGKVVIITGGRSGIGQATALRFAAEGANLVVPDVQDTSRQVVEMTQGAAQAIFVQADVSRAPHVDNLIEKTVAAFGRLDVLVNNAGVSVRKSVVDTTESEWDHLIAVNLKGMFLCSRAAIPVMRRGGGGAIVNVASGLGLVGGSEAAAYCASKGGVLQLTRAMAVDHADDGIRVNCVCPGPVVTPMLETIINSDPNPEARRQRMAESTLLKRLGRPEEIASVILFLASDEASFMTGAIVTVDGGATAR